MKGRCPRGFRNVHETHIEGNPRSAMTWYVCEACGKREPRGPGLFHGRPDYTPPTLEQRVAKLEAALTPKDTPSESEE